MDAEHDCGDHEWGGEEQQGSPHIDPRSVRMQVVAYGAVEPVTPHAQSQSNCDGPGQDASGRQQGEKDVWRSDNEHVPYAEVAGGRPRLVRQCTVKSAFTTN